MTVKQRDWFPISLVFAEAGLYVANDMYLPAMPTISQELHASTDMVQLTLTLFFLGIAMCYPFVGPFSDRFGRRSMVMLGVVIFIVTSIGCVISSSIEQLIFWRCIQGSSIAFVVVAGYATIHERYEQMQAIMILAWMGSITVLAPAFGPLLGSGILWFAHWHMIFALQILWGVIALVAIHFNMPHEDREHEPHTLHLGYVLRTYRSILMTPGFTLNTLAFTGLLSGFIAWIAAGAFVVISDYHYTPMQFGLIQCAIFLAYIAGSMVVRQLIQKFSINYVIDLGLGLASTGVLLNVIIAIAFPQLLLIYILAFILFSFGCGVAFNCLGRLAIEACTESMGSRMAMMTTLMSIGNVASTSVISVLHDSLRSFTWVLLVCTVLGIVARVALVYGKPVVVAE